MLGLFLEAAEERQDVMISWGGRPLLLYAVVVMSGVEVLVIPHHNGVLEYGGWQVLGGRVIQAKCLWRGKRIEYHICCEGDGVGL